MPIPNYQTLMLPLLRISADGKEHRISDVIGRLAEEFGLTDEERQITIPSGNEPKFNNKTHWAKTYLSQAGLLELTRRAHFRITDRGRGVLSANPEKIDNKFLDQFPEFRSFKARSRTPLPTSLDSVLPPVKVPTSLSSQLVSEVADPTMVAVSDAILDAETPDEILRMTSRTIEATLAKQLIDRILLAPPVFFENLIVTLLIAMGYGGSRENAGRAIGKSGDGGIDGVIDQDPLGLDRVYIQAKRYKADSGVGAPDIQAFSGSLGANKASKGIFVTTSYFTKAASQFAEKHQYKLVLVDGEQLASLMIRHNVGVRVDDTIYIKKLDEDFFGEDG